MARGNDARPYSSAAVPMASPLGKRPVLYESGYHGRIINKPGMLENIKHYMEENPLRACIRKECPRLEPWPAASTVLVRVTARNRRHCA